MDVVGGVLGADLYPLSGSACSGRGYTPVGPMGTQTVHLCDVFKSSFETAWPVLAAVLSVGMLDCWITTLSPRLGLEIRVLDRKLVGRDGMRDLFEIPLIRVEPFRLVEEIRRLPGVREVQVVETDHGRLLGITRSENCTGCAILAKSDCFVGGAICRKSPSFEWNLVLSDRGGLRRLISRLERHGYAARLVRIAAIKDSMSLTHRQREVLSTALDLGYFDYPKRVLLGELANRLGASKSAVSQVLRNAQTRVVTEYLGSGTIRDA